MTLCILGHPFAYEMECLARAFFPGEQIRVVTGGAAEDGGFVATEITQVDGEYRLRAELCLEGEKAGAAGRLPLSAGDKTRELELGKLLYRILCAYTGKTLPWGMLTGVRPARLCRTLMEQGNSRGQVREILLERYLVRPEKADLALQVLGVEQGLLAQNRPDCFSLYISIPFCPTRCLYCSFVSQAVDKAVGLIPDYVRLLCEEIRYAGRLMREKGLRLQTVYMGGGTPTTLSPDQLRQVMGAVRESFPWDHMLEYTVEAGRPDTLDLEKLGVLREMGARRVSVNPQTMDDEILRRIGRDHTAAAVEEGFHLARQAGFSQINMDLIAGLPGETGAEFDATIKKVLELGPENVTVHTLTVKRSSDLRQREGGFQGPGIDVSPLLDRAGRELREAGYRPYYLYRQKGTVENLENIGYSLPGNEGLYNVFIMEEVQTILAVGAGAVSKVCSPGQRIQRVFNYKFPHEYIRGFEEILARKRVLVGL